MVMRRLGVDALGRVICVGQGLVQQTLDVRVRGCVVGEVVSTIFVAVGLPIADPIIGLIITGLIFHATWDSWVTIRQG